MRARTHTAAPSVLRGSGAASATKQADGRGYNCTHQRAVVRRHCHVVQWCRCVGAFAPPEERASRGTAVTFLCALGIPTVSSLWEVLRGFCSDGPLDDARCRRRDDGPRPGAPAQQLSIELSADRVERELHTVHQHSPGPPASPHTLNRHSRRHPRLCRGRSRPAAHPRCPLRKPLAPRDALSRPPPPPQQQQQQQQQQLL